MQYDEMTRNELIKEIEILQHKICENESNQSILMQRHMSLVKALGQIVYEDYVQENRIIWGGDYTGILGYSKAEMGNDSKSWTEKIHPDDVKKAQDEFDNSIAQKRPFDLEYRFRCRDGSYRWMHDRGIVHFDAQGQKECIIKIMLDIDERKKIQNELHLFHTIAEEANFGIATADLDYKLVYVNKYFASVHGYQPEELLGEKISTLHPQNHLEEVGYLLNQLKILGSFPPVQVWHRNKSGREFPMLMTAVVIEDKLNHSFLLTTTAIDITEEHHAEEELRTYRDKMVQAERLSALGTLSATMAHELHQPLSTIRLLLQDSMEDLKNTLPLEKIKDSICANITETLKAVSNASSIIQSFRNFSRVPSLGKIVKLNLKCIAEQIVHLWAAKAKQSKLKIVLTNMDNLPLCSGKEAEIEQIFFILIENAIQAADGKKWRKLEITSAVKANNIELQFTDNCSGIAPENIGKIFEPFFTTKSPGEGTGLGLCIVRRILDSIGGSIHVESQIGVGTTFFLRFLLDSK
jgi:PAS domain S-box-containing protein